MPRKLFDVWQALKYTKSASEVVATAINFRLVKALRIFKDAAHHTQKGNWNKNKKPNLSENKK